MMKRTLPWLLCAAALILSAAPAVSAEPVSASKPITYGPAKLLAELENKAITESSGLAVSRRRPGVIWTHNDSGDKARIFAFDRHGQHWGEFLVPGAQAIDWEDMASFVDGDKSYLLLGDVGDNPKRRSQSTLYLVAEPEGTDAVARMLDRIRFQYEDGPQNCEALAIDPTSKTLLLVSKGFNASVYQLSLPPQVGRPPSFGNKSLDNKLHTARRIARTPLPWVTAMDISPDGRRAMVLTYGHAYEYSRRPGESWKTAFSREPRAVEMPDRTQGESICYSADGKGLYLTSEKTPTPLWEVPVVDE